MLTPEEKLDASVKRLLARRKGAIWSRLEKIVEKKKVTCNNFVYYIYTIKRNADGHYKISDLIDYIFSRIVDYVIPKGEIETAKKLDSQEQTTCHIVELADRAKKLFNQMPNSGESGELLLYILAVDVLGFPLILNKMSLKTSTDVHYHGADGIHVKFDPQLNLLYMYWCEAKLYKNFSIALKACLRSIQDFVVENGGIGSRKARDLDLVVSNLDKTITDSEEQQLWLQYFDKDSDKSNLVKHAGICFIGFDSEKYDYPLSDKSPPEYFAEEIKIWDKTLHSALVKNIPLQEHEMHFFLMPMQSVRTFRELFRQKLGGVR